MVKEPAASGLNLHVQPEGCRPSRSLGFFLTFVPVFYFCLLSLFFCLCLISAKTSASLSARKPRQSFCSASELSAPRLFKNPELSS